eukprot:SAG22_NODE_312_length_12614_cov_4.783540_2_plen_449_part_00
MSSNDVSTFKSLDNNMPRSRAADSRIQEHRHEGNVGTGGLTSGGVAADIVDEEVHRIQNKKQKTATRKRNRINISKWILWLCYAEDPSIRDWFSAGFVAAVGEAAKKAYVQNYCVAQMESQEGLATAKGNPAVDFETMSFQPFAKWILNVTLENGSKPSQATYDAYRRGLTQFFTDHSKYYNPNFDQQLSNFYSGLKTDTAELAQQGIGRVRKGKSPLSIDLYKHLSTLYLTLGSSGNVFAHLFLILSWNLMARAKNTATIGHMHMKVAGDAIGIWFCHQKNDQKGQRAMTRHVYANPAAPEICAFTALALFWLRYSAEMAGSHLFGKSRVYEKYRKVHKDFESNEVVDTIAKHIGDMKNLGTHSARKGGGTYATAGAGAFCPVIPIHQRGGWTMHGCDDEYFWSDSGGDWYVGRLLSGLPPNSAAFASLPPGKWTEQATMFSGYQQQ